MYKRAEYQIITDRIKESRKFIQVVMGALQFGIAVRSQIELQIFLGLFPCVIKFKHHFYDLLFGQRLQVFFSFAFGISVCYKVVA